MKRIPLAALALVAGLAATFVAGAQQTPPSDPKLTAAQANVRLGIEYLKKGEVALARDKIERALTQQPRDVGVQLGAALLYERLADDKRAEQHYRQALKVDSTSPEAQNAYASYLCRHDKAQQGEDMFLRAAQNPLSRAPEVGYTNAGVCARAAGRLDAAEKHLRQALGIRPASREALFQMTSLSVERSAYLQGRAFLQRYMAVGPVSPEVLLLGVRIERALGDAEAADGYARRLRSEFPDSAQAAELAGLPKGSG
jgi:type IV pilus assembly protein PilF